MAFRQPPPGFIPAPRFNGPPRMPAFANFRMQFRPGFGPVNGSNLQSPTIESTIVTNESGLLFVSNIDENCPNDLLKDILDAFGKVEKWTRIQGPDGNFPPFGFCGYEESSAAINAILTLNNFCIGSKRLNVKPDEKAKQKLVDYIVKERISKRLSRKELGKELMPDDGDRDQIIECRKKLRDILYNRDPKLVANNDDDLIDEKKEKSETPSEKRSSSRSKKKHSKKKSSRKRSRSPRRSRSRSRGPSKKTKKRKRSESSYSSQSNSDSEKQANRRDSSSDYHIDGLDSNDSDVQLDRKERKRLNKRKDEDYLRELKKHEERERRMAKQYEREDDGEQTKKKSQQKEAKRLAQFLEDYDDDRDDSKYYRSSMLIKRKRDYEIELEADEKDRREEAKEIDAIKAMILADKKRVSNGKRAALTEVSSNGKGVADPFRYSFVEEKSTPSELPQSGSNEWTPAYDNPSTSQFSSESSKPQAISKVITFQSKVLSKVNSVFAEADEDEDAKRVVKKKLKPFEITVQDRMESMTAEEKKKMITELIQAVPKIKGTLFEYQVAWVHVDDELVEQKIKPWVEKKIRDYLNDDEPSLVSFICERVKMQTEPSKLLGDLAMILDEEAESFIIKLWRLIIFQTEAKKIGLNVDSSKA